MASVCVLTLKGRRQTVKCTPNTTILQILEEVCKKQGINPEDYDLKHHSRILDTSSTFRFSGLPNNAQLELINATKSREDSDVVIALNLESGSRPMGTFSPADSLLDVVLKLSPESVGPGKNPTLTYMIGSEYYGDQLKDTTLKSLGLMRGKAVLRLINRSREQLKTQANISAPMPSKVVEEKPFRRTLKKTEDDLTIEPMKSAPSQSEPNNSNWVAGTSDSVEKSEDNTKRYQPQTCKTDIIKLAREKRKLGLKESPVEEDIFDQANSGSEYILKNEEESMEVCSNDDDYQSNQGYKLNQCTPIKPSPVPLSNKIEENIEYIGERNALVFSLDSISTHKSHDLPDDFFDLDINDARKILRDIKRDQEGTVNAQFKTTEMRDRERQEKYEFLLNTYQRVVIRVQFPDRAIIQGTFKPDETFTDVMTFVRDFLEDKNINFYLYTAPPKCVLNPSDTLINAGCIPQALIHFGTNSCETAFLRSNLLEKYTTGSKASLSAAKIRQQYTVRVEAKSHEQQSDSSNNVAAAASTSASCSDPSTSHQVRSYQKPQSTEKVPKWFKPNK